MHKRGGRGWEAPGRGRKVKVVACRASWESLSIELSIYPPIYLSILLRKPLDWTIYLSTWAKWWLSSAGGEWTPLKKDWGLNANVLMRGFQEERSGGFQLCVSCHNEVSTPTLTFPHSENNSVLTPRAPSAARDMCSLKNICWQGSHLHACTLSRLQMNRGTPFSFQWIFISSVYKTPLIRFCISNVRSWLASYCWRRR